MPRSGWSAQSFRKNIRGEGDGEEEERW